MHAEGHLRVGSFHQPINIRIMKTVNINIAIGEYSLSELNDLQQTLVKKAIEATANSYSPYSHFKVGACLRLDDGTMVIGANQENAAYPVGLCAERTAIFAAQAQHPEHAVTHIAIAARNTYGELVGKPISPCGSCRQVILEIEERYGRDIEVLLYGRDKIYVIKSIKDMLPLCFVNSDMEGDSAHD